MDLKQPIGNIGVTKKNLFYFLIVFFSRNEILYSQDILINIDTNRELGLLISGIEEVGYKLGQTRQTADLMTELYKLLDDSPEQIGQGCLGLYLMKKFLHSQLNKFLDEGNIQTDITYRHLVRLLYFLFNHPSSTGVHSATVYHGMDLSSSTIDAYREAATNGTTLQYMSFISTTPSVEIAKHFTTNTLFIMNLNKVYTNEKRSIDISNYSGNPGEQEILLAAGIEFNVNKIEYDENNKCNIFLDVYV